MPRATCRCGHELKVPDDGTDRVVCPKCSARVRLRLKGSAPDDGFIRFFCPCGRRLKVPADRPPAHGKCPDCGRVVPVPRETGPVGKPPGHPEADTADLSPQDLAALQRWAQDHVARRDDDEPTPPVISRTNTAPASTRAEAGLRICPRCGLPVHLGADACRACGTAVPRR